MAKDAETARRAFEKMVGVGTVNGQTIPVQLDTKGRSYYSPIHDFVALSRGSGAETAVHEYAHWLETHDPAIHQKLLAFYGRRTAGEQAQPLSLLTGNPAYNAWEVARKDQFLEPYMGKEYFDPSGSQYATELLSMGMEMLYNKTAELASGDPDMFDTIFNILRGL